MEEKNVKTQHVVCECGYHNHAHSIQKYGTCIRCGKVLIPKAKYKYEMNKKLRLWRGKLK